MKEIYIVATAEKDPVKLDVLRETYESEEITFVAGEDGNLFSVRSENTRIDVRFDGRDAPLGWTPGLLTGTPASLAALEKAQGFYRVSFEPGKPQGSVAVFEALWAVRAMLEHMTAVVVDVTAFKVHSPEDVEELTDLEFDVRDHITLHAVEVGQTSAPFWVHSHGMSKFAVRDVEMFNVNENDLEAAETFFHELCTDLAFGQGPAPREAVATSVGDGFVVLPSEEARTNLFGIGPDAFEGHGDFYYTIVSPEGRHSMTEVLHQYRDRFVEESPEEADKRRNLAKELMGAFKARFLRKGLMDPLAFLVRAPFEVHPNGAAPTEEMLWAEVIAWEDDTLIAKLVDGGKLTTEWRRGAHVEVEESQLNAIALSREGRTLDEEEMRGILLAERPM